MATTGESLAARFEQANDELIRAVEGMPDDKWKAWCPEEGRSAGVVANHVAVSIPTIIGIVQALGMGQPIPTITREMVDQGNAQHAQQNASCNQAETLDLLRRNGQAAAAALRGMSDEQFSRTGTLVGQQMSAQQIAENILIGHAPSHLQSITAAR